jgi:hypothetical protein
MRRSKERRRPLAASAGENGAPEPEIEIMPEMIEAGGVAMESYLGEISYPLLDENLVEAILRRLSQPFRKFLPEFLGHLEKNLDVDNMLLNVG